MDIEINSQAELTIYLMDSYLKFKLNGGVNISINEIKSLPNDQELGKYVRSLLNKNN